MIAKRNNEPKSLYTFNTTTYDFSVFLGRFFFLFSHKSDQICNCQKEKKNPKSNICVGGVLISSRWNILDVCEIHKLDQLKF